MTALPQVDHTAIRTNQAVIIGLNLFAFILDLPFLVGVTGLVMLLGTLFKRPGFGFIYQKILGPAGFLRPNLVEDNPEPHRFAQGFGSVFLLAGTLFLTLGSNLLGWTLVWVVIALAALNLFGGFCVGCAMYYWLNRMNVPGFVKSPLPGTVPGMRPGREEK
jgi:hypothetical protein